MKSKLILALISCSALCALANAQNGCGDTVNWTSPTCQMIGAGQLNTAMVNGINDPKAWTVISRHGEYGQNENECNVPSAVVQNNANGGTVTIHTSKKSNTCGAWYYDASNGPSSIRNTPSSFPYQTGDIQWNTFNFLYGTVIARLKVPNSNTGVWPALWFLRADQCQISNKYSGDTQTSTTPNDTNSPCTAYGSSTYQEIDMLEFALGYGWPQLNVHRGSSNPSCTVAQSPVDDGNFHTYLMSWTNGSITTSVDGTDSGCSMTGSSVPNTAQFLIFQTQTTASGYGCCLNDGNLGSGADVVLDYVKVCNSTITAAQCTAAATNDVNVIFYDDFNATGIAPAPPTGLTADVK